MIELTTEQVKSLEMQGYPPQVQNPQTKEIYVLLPAEAYERVRQLLEEEDDIPAIREMYSLMERVLDAPEDSTEGV